MPIIPLAFRNSTIKIWARRLERLHRCINYSFVDELFGCQDIFISRNTRHSCQQENYSSFWKRIGPLRTLYLYSCTKDSCTTKWLLYLIVKINSLWISNLVWYDKKYSRFSQISSMFISTVSLQMKLTWRNFLHN